MMERDQKIKMTKRPITTYIQDAERFPTKGRAFSIKKYRATPWVILIKVNSMLRTSESSSVRTFFKFLRGTAAPCHIFGAESKIQDVNRPAEGPVGMWAVAMQKELVADPFQV